MSPSTWGGRVQRYGPGARPHTTRGEASGSPLGLQRFSRRQHVPTNTHCAAIVSARGRAQSSWDVTKFCPFDLPLRALPISDFPFQNSPCTRGAGSRARSPPPWPPCIQSVRAPFWSSLRAASLLRAKWVYVVLRAHYVSVTFSCSHLNNLNLM